MSERRDLRDAVGHDVPELELRKLERIDELLRSTPAPPEIPDALTRSVLAVPGRGRYSRPAWIGRLALAAALALASVTFAVGLWVGGGPDGPVVADTVLLSATELAPADAVMEIHVLPLDDAGNWPMAADVSGLPPLPAEGYYEVWLTREGEAVASCGRFAVNERGEARNVWLNAPYRFKEYDRWVVVAWTPGEGTSGWLLDGPVVVPA